MVDGLRSRRFIGSSDIWGLGIEELGLGLKYSKIGVELEIHNLPGDLAGEARNLLASKAFLKVIDQTLVFPHDRLRGFRPPKICV